MYNLFKSFKNFLDNLLFHNFIKSLLIDFDFKGYINYVDKENIYGDNNQIRKHCLTSIETQF